MFSSVVAARRTSLTSGQTINCCRGLFAVSFVRKMRGGSQSSLLRASDGKLYVVKLNGGPQGANVLANEALGSMLAEQLGLPVAAHTSIELSDQFLDNNPEVWFERHTGYERPAAGLHYASKLVQAEEDASVYEILPRSWFSRVENRSDFLGMLLLDIWCNNTDNRQAVFVESKSAGSLKAVFIDHGHMFGGPDGAYEARPGAAQFLDVSIYDGLFSEQEVEDWMRKIRALTRETAYAFISVIPTEWCVASLADRIAELFDRRQELAAKISQQENILQQRGINYRKRNHAASEPVRVHSDRIRQPLRSWDQVSLSAA